MSERNRPDRAIVLRIVIQEAAATNVEVESVLGVSRDGRAVRARRLAMQRIVRETGCNVTGLAAVWGCNREVAGWYVGRERALTPAYDVQTIGALRWLYPLRAEGIIAGRDAATNRDIASWRRLGQRSAA